MHGSDLFRLGEIMVATMATMSATKWPYDDRSFALAAARLAAAGNSFAAKFHAAKGPVGMQCQDFRAIRTLMHSALLVSYDSVDNDYFNVRVGLRVARVLFQRTEATDLEMAEARELLQAHLDEYAKSRAWS